ncbi:MAG: hypothetical protein ACK4ND_18865 [Cytophagaceae bacterium]
MDSKSKDVRMPLTRSSLMYRLECLKGQGYNREFQYTEEGLKDLDSGEVFSPQDLTIVEHQRFEGISDPDDMAILYAIETKANTKGIVLGAFGIYADSDLISFMHQVDDTTVDSMAKAKIKQCIEK